MYVRTKWLFAWLAGCVFINPSSHPPYYTKKYDSVWETITNIFQASLGELLEFAKSVIKKVGFRIILYLYVCRDAVPSLSTPTSNTMSYPFPVSTNPPILTTTLFSNANKAGGVFMRLG